MEVEMKYWIKEEIKRGEEGEMVGYGKVEWERMKGSKGKELKVRMKLDGYVFEGYVRFVRKEK
jgi:hypothetical protein